MDGNNSFVTVGDSGLILQSDPLASLSASMIPGVGFRVNLSGASPTDYQLQRTANFDSWQTLGSFDAQGTFLDARSESAGPFIYRAISP
jgi:hypothetical protein